MKKSLIATAGVAAFAVAAVPAAVFATDTAVTELTDNLTITVESGCTMSRTTGNGSYSETLSSNSYAEITGSTFTFACTDATWTVSAEGAGTSGHLTDLYYSTGDAAIATGTDLDGAHSGWGFKIAVGGAGATAAGTYATAYNVIPSSTTVIANGSAASSTATVTPTYKVSTNSTQTPGTYTGAVKYTVTDTASS